TPAQDYASVTRSDGARAWRYFTRFMIVSIAGAIVGLMLRGTIRTDHGFTPQVIIAIVVGLLLAIGQSTHLAQYRGLPRPVFVGIAGLFPGAYLISAIGLFFYQQADPAMGRRVGQIGRGGRWMMVFQAPPVLLFGVLAVVNWHYLEYFFNNPVG